MLNPWCLVLSIACLVFGVICLVAPKVLQKMNAGLNRTFETVDRALMRYRYVMGVLLLIVSYCFYRLASLVSHLT